MKERIKQLDTRNMTSKQIAAELGRKVGTVRSYLDKYHIPYIKKFSKVKVEERDLNEVFFSWEDYPYGIF